MCFICEKKECNIQWLLECWCDKCFKKLSDKYLELRYKEKKSREEIVDILKKDLIK